MWLTSSSSTNCRPELVALDRSASVTLTGKVTASVTSCVPEASMPSHTPKLSTTPEGQQLPTASVTPFSQHRPFTVDTAHTCHDIATAQEAFRSCCNQCPLRQHVPPLRQSTKTPAQASSRSESIVLTGCVGKHVALSTRVELAAATAGAVPSQRWGGP